MIAAIHAFPEWATAPIVDACVRLDIPLRLAPANLRAVIPGTTAAGPVLPVRHHGSVDVFFEAFSTASPGDVLVIDNAGRLDEGCIGDLTVLDGRAAGIGGIVCWGAHRDTTELLQLGVPIFSYGTLPAGPRELRPRPHDALERAAVGSCVVDASDFVFADADGAVFVSKNNLPKVLPAAREIWATEREHSRRAAAGISLREQFRFAEYLERRAKDPSYTLRQHLRQLGSVSRSKSSGDLVIWDLAIDWAIWQIANSQSIAKSPNHKIAQLIHFDELSRRI
jgi:4-hydroxy-4-methyl-2-oxoglutarate aldolase